MENKDTLQNQPRHFRVEITDSMTPEAKREAEDANLFLLGLSAVETWKSEIINPRINQIESSGEKTRWEDIYFINNKTRQIMFLLGLMRMNSRIRSIEEDPDANIPQGLSEAFIACFGEHMKLPENFELNLAGARQYVTRGIERISKAIGNDDQKESFNLLNEVPGNFWKVVATANHDILNPVSNMQTAATMLINDHDQGSSEAIDPELLKVMINSAPRLESALEESFYLLSNEFPKETISAGLIRNEIVSSLSSRLKRKLGVSFEMKTPSEDAAKMGQVIWAKTWLQTLTDNIYQNETKAYRDKSGGKVTASLSSQEGQLVVTIEDDAGGIQDERILKEGFGYGYGGWQSQEENLGQKVESTRIGMAGQDEMIRKYSGRIVPENYTTEDGGTGTRIKIILPLAV